MLTIGSLKRRCMYARMHYGSKYCTLPELVRNGEMVRFTVHPADGKVLPYEVAINLKRQIIWRRDYGGQWVQVKEIPLDI